MLFMENLAKITTLNCCGSFWMHFFKFQGKKRKMQFTSLGLEYCSRLCYLRPGAQFFPMQTSRLANNIYLLYKLLCCARMSNPKNSHNSTLVKLLYFFYMFNITNQLLTHQSLFMPICKVDKWTWLRIHQGGEGEKIWKVLR